MAVPEKGVHAIIIQVFSQVYDLKPIIYSEPTSRIWTFKNKMTLPDSLNKGNYKNIAVI